MSVPTIPDEDPAPDNRPGLERDDVFHLLQSGRRRAVLSYLLTHEEETYVMRDIAEAIAAWENETTVEALSSSQRQRVYIALYQSHLPKLDEYGVIEYEQSRGTVVPTELASLFGPYIEDEFRGETAVTGSDGSDPGEDTGIVRSIRSILR
ncbi:DUF7344 domain-containing protein [Natronorarus salvus]|uniref:DUF7344 domain-containing protein n=1 Tax=Natronorarus salvus TaxID=3117733 RepID=UPI002F268D60